jgi:hypothetical protein
VTPLLPSASELATMARVRALARLCTSLSAPEARKSLEQEVRHLFEVCLQLGAVSGTPLPLKFLLEFYKLVLYLFIAGGVSLLGEPEPGGRANEERSKDH